MNFPPLSSRGQTGSRRVQISAFFASANASKPSTSAAVVGTSSWSWRQCAGVSRSQLRRHASFPLFLKIDVSDSLAAVNDKLKRARQLLALQLTSRPTPCRETQGGAYTDGQDGLGAVAYHDFLNPLRSE